MVILFFPEEHLYRHSCNLQGLWHVGQNGDYGLCINTIRYRKSYFGLSTGCPIYFVMARYEMQQQNWTEEKWQSFAYKRKKKE